MSDVTILEKGTPVSLQEKAPNLKELYIGMGWDVNEGSGGTYDLDVTAVLADANKKVIGDAGVIYYGRLTYEANGEVIVQHSADNLTGAGDGDDEWMTVKLEKLPTNVEHMFVIVNIYDAKSKNQHFGNVNSSFVRLLDNDSKKEFARHELKNEFTNKSGVLVADVYKESGLWKVKVLAEGVDGSISEIMKAQGLQ